MLGNMLNDLAEAIRRWTGKKSVAGIRKVTNHSAKNSIIDFKLWEDSLYRSERCRNVWDMCRGQSDCSPGIFIGKVESAQLGNPLARFLHVNCDLGQGPWVWKRGQAMQ